MNIIDFLDKNRMEKPDQVYLLVGEDRYQLWLAEKELLRQNGFDSIEADIIRFDRSPTADELSVALASPGFFATQTLGIIEDNQWFSSEKKSEEKKNEEAKIANLLEELPEDSKVIIKVAKADKRGSLYKKIVSFGTLLEGDLLKGQLLRTYVQKYAKGIGLAFKADGMKWLLDQWDLLDGISAGLVQQELEKMWLYRQGEPLTADEIENILSELPEISSFKLLDAWGSLGGADKSFSFLKELLKNGEAPLRLLGLFTWHVRNLWQVKALEKESKDRIALQVGIRPFQVDRLLQITRKMTAKQVDFLMTGLAETDLALKSGQPPGIVLENLLLRSYGK